MGWERGGQVLKVHPSVYFLSVSLSFDPFECWCLRHRHYTHLPAQSLDLSDPRHSILAVPVPLPYPYPYPPVVHATQAHDHLPSNRSRAGIPILSAPPRSHCPTTCEALRPFEHQRGRQGPAGGRGRGRGQATTAVENGHR